MKKLFKKIWGFIEGLFVKAEEQVERYAPIAVNIVEGVKRTVENNQFKSAVEIVKFAIPGDTDDKIIDKVLAVVQEYIPKIALQLNIIESITDIEDVNDQMVAVVNALKHANADEQSDYWHELAAFVLKKLADGKITLGEAGSIAEYHYQNYVKLRK
ncbi:MAG: hypothetical protein ACQEQ0_13840 [Bacteroidota bacterium]